MTIMLEDFSNGVPSYAVFGTVVYMQDGEHAPQKSAGSTIGTFNWGLPKPQTEFTAVEGGAGSMLAGTYKVHMVASSSYFGAKGMPFQTDPVSVTLANDNSSINISGIPICGDPQVDSWLIYRTTLGTNAPFYYAGTARNGTTSIVLNGNDDSLPTTDVLEPPGYGLLDDVLLDMAGPFRYDKPPIKSRCAAWDGRLWCGGEKAYSKGFASATEDNTTITGSGAADWISGFEGKFFQFEGEPTRYEITEVKANQVLDISVPYKLPPAATAAPSDAVYEIKGDVFELAYSAISEPDHFPYDGVLQIGREDGGEIIALVPYNESLVVFKDNGVHIVFRSGNSQFPYNIRKTNSPVGCVAPNSIVEVNGVLFWYSGDDFWALSGNTAAKISTPLSDVFTVDLVSKQYVVGAYVDGRIYWAVSYSSIEYLDTVLVYDVENKFWDTPWTNVRILDMKAKIDNGEEVLYFSEWGESLYKVNNFDADYLSDIADDVYHGTVTSAASNMLSDSTASFDVVGSGLNGALVQIRSGTGVGQARYIESNTSTQLILESTWDITPDTTSEYTIGAIDFDVRFKEEAAGSPHSLKHFKHAEVLLAE